MVRGCPAAVVLGTMRWVVFVGRARALSRLLVAVDEAAAGCARLVLVSGEAGIGKTTLVGVAAARSGLLVGWGSWAEAGRTPAFWPWTVALRGLLAALAASDVAELTRSDAAELARLVPELAAEPTVLDPTVLDPGAGGHGGDADAARLRVGAENPVMSHVTCTYSCRRPPGRSHRRGRAVAPERGGCGSEELSPGRTGPQRGGIDAGALQDLQTVEATTRWPRPTSSP
jgi:hypothetical protein